MFRDGLDPVELMALDYFTTQQEQEKRQEKLNYIVRAVLESGEESFDITPLCRNLKIKLTPDEFNWILEQVNDD